MMFVLIKVDYDTEKDLKKQYGVTIQHTLVQTDSDGNKIAKWVWWGNRYHTCQPRIIFMARDIFKKFKFLFVLLGLAALVLFYTGLNTREIDKNRDLIDYLKIGGF